MNFEDLQKAWQSQNASGKVTIDAGVLLNEVRRNQQQFRRTIFWRDVREVGASAVTTVVFLVLGIRRDSWSLYLLSACCFFVGAFFLVDRILQRRKQTKANDPLKACLDASLHEVNHQIWLLKNIFWWYLLPFIIGMGAFLGQTLWRELWSLRLDGEVASIATPIAFLGACPALVIFFVLIYGFIYRMIQRAVRNQLAPRRQELEALLAETGNPVTPAEIKNMKIKITVLVTFLVTAVVAAGVYLTARPPQATIPQEPWLEAIRKKHDLPALAVVVVKDGQICERAAVGVRKWGDATPVTVNDVFHIGGCTKPMTATLAAMLIEAGKLRWDTTIAEVFPELKGKMDKQYETVTVEQLLQHRSGIPIGSPRAAWKKAWEKEGTPMQQRREFIEAVLAQPPAAIPGTQSIYSNQGYTIVGAMLEKIMDQDYESLLTDRLFQPLHMDTAGFGPPGTLDQVDQPWGHARRLYLTRPDQIDNPPVLAPAGRVHCSLDDLARFAMLHLQHTTNGLLKPETLVKLRTPPAASDQTSGWMALPRGWANGYALFQNGSNTRWYIVMWLAPNRDFAVIAATNIDDPESHPACDEAATAMILKWLPQ